MAESQCESNTIKEAVERANGFLYATESKIDIDVSDALKGLKALRREANETIKVLDQLQERIGKFSKDNDNQAIFSTSGQGIYIKNGKFGVSAYTGELLYPQKQIFDVGLDFTQVFIDSFTNYSRYLVIDYEQWNENEPIFFGFIRHDKYIRKTKNKERKFGKTILDLGDFDEDVKEITLDISVCSLRGNSCNFKITGIYFQD
ncbi:hypothetical protein [Priestia aryabhattai]|uniref:Uncharacterized protein n=1 Tax=Priestia aryabhattai TaxID=412384 RepID=A0ABD7X447_PRIAR|nr:hypothetical protein [Priestia aryabhattai]WEA47275.1 hypothetical protein PWO00_28570 [Priestia aryabhattai]